MRSRGRPDGLPLLALLLVLGGLAGTFAMLAPRPADLTLSAPTVSGVPAVTLPGFGPRGASIVGYEDRADVGLTLPIHNGGRLPVTVTSVSLGGGPRPLLAVNGAEGLPLRLAPGATGEVTLATRLTNCRYFHEREMQTYDGARLQVRSLGRLTTRVLPFPRPLLVKSPMLVGCADRKLDRQAHDRGDVL